MTEKVDGLELEKDCPKCGSTGTALGDEDGNHLGVWECKNDKCGAEVFVSEKMQFYRTGDSNWTWNTLEEHYNV